MASLLLSLEAWKVVPYSTFKCAWSALPTGLLKHEAVMSDALKMAYNDSKDNLYLDTFANLRTGIFHKGEASR